MPDIKWNTARAGDIETGVLVQFAQVVTVPVSVDGRADVRRQAVTASPAAYGWLKANDPGPAAGNGAGTADRLP